MIVAYILGGLVLVGYLTVLNYLKYLIGSPRCELSNCKECEYGNE